MRALDAVDPSTGERRERLLRSAETAVHQLVLTEHHRELGAPSHQTKFDVGTGHSGRLDLQPRNHALLLRCLIRSRETMHLGKTLRFKKIASDVWHVGAGMPACHRKRT